MTLTLHIRTSGPQPVGNWWDCDSDSETDKLYMYQMWCWASDVVCSRIYAINSNSSIFDCKDLRQVQELTQRDAQTTFICTYTLMAAITLCWHRLHTYITYTPLRKRWCHCTWQLSYILHESWLLGVFRVYTTLKPRPSDVCSAYAPRLWLGLYALQTSSGLGSGCIYAEYTP